MWESAKPVQEAETRLQKLSAPPDSKPTDGSADDIKVKNRDGVNEIQFFFPKTSPIAKDDKEVIFKTMIGRLKVENKFRSQEDDPQQETGAGLNLSRPH